MSDATDCLIEAYDMVAHRAYENFLARGPGPDGELQDWFRAERELLLNFPIHLQETREFVYALASVPDSTGARLKVGIESHWLVILANHAKSDHPEPAAAGSHSAPPHADSRSAIQTQNGTHRPAKSVCILELPADVDVARAVAVLSDGLLGIRMPKIGGTRFLNKETAK